MFFDDTISHMGALPNNLLLTQKEFFLLDETRGNLEYWAGQIVQLENNTASHGRLIMNLGAALSAQLPAGCGQMTNVGVRAGHRVHFLKPDLMIVCGKEEYFGKRRDIVVNPKVIFEVLSFSTAGYDKGEKLRHYRTIESLREYVLISQTEAKVNVYRRESGEFWQAEEVSGLSSTVRLSSVSSSVTLAQIYRDVTLAS